MLNEEIPDDRSTIVCCLLLAYHLNPLAELYTIEVMGGNISNDQNKGEESSSEEPGAATRELLETITKVVTSGFKYVHAIVSLIGREICIVLKHHNDFFAYDGVDLLQTLLEAFFVYDNNSLLEMAIESIRELCLTTEFHESLADFLFKPNADGQTVLNRLVHLAVTNAELAEDILSLFIDLKRSELYQNVLDDDARVAIYASAIAEHEKIVVPMMRAFDGDLHLPLIKTFNQLNAEVDEVQSIISSIAENFAISVPEILEVIKSNVVKDLRVARRGCQVLEILVAGYDIPMMNQVFACHTKVLHSCAANEKLFCSMLVVFVQLVKKNSEIVVSLKADFKEPLAGLLTEMFTNFQNFSALQQILSAVGHFATWMPKELVVHLTKTRWNLYDELMQAETNAIVDSEDTLSHEHAMLKLDMILESGKLAPLSYFQCDTVTIITSKYLDPEHPLFPFAARLRVTVMRPIWYKLVADITQPDPSMVLPYDLRFVADSAAELLPKLIPLMKRRNMNLLQARNVFTALMDLLAFFRLKPIEVNERVVMSKHLQLTWQQMEEVIEFAEFYVFELDSTCCEGTDMENGYDVQHQHDMLAGLVWLVKANDSLANLQAMHKLVKFYQVNCEFRKELGMLLSALYVHFRFQFHDIIGRTILHFAQHGSFEGFSKFQSSIERFFKRHHSGDVNEVSKAKFRICMFILEQLSKLGDDRLRILEFLSGFVNGMTEHHLEKM